MIEARKEKCMECGKHFIKRHGNQRYCSVKCQKLANKRKARERSARVREQKKSGKNRNK